MRRNPALVALSRDHHQALVVAQHLRRATEDTLEKAIARFRAYWLNEGEEHFAAEEQILLPALGDEVRREAVISDVLLDHVVLRRGAHRLLDGDDDAGRLEAAHEVGRLVVEHVRLEERSLFPLLERTLSERELEDLASALEHAPVLRVNRTNPARVQPSE